jgi:hypothetical protein
MERCSCLQRVSWPQNGTAKIRKDEQTYGSRGLCPRYDVLRAAINRDIGTLRRFLYSYDAQFVAPICPSIIGTVPGDYALMRPPQVWLTFG